MERSDDKAPAEMRSLWHSLIPITTVRKIAKDHDFSDTRMALLYALLRERHRPASIRSTWMSTKYELSAGKPLLISKLDSDKVHPSFMCHGCIMKYVRNPTCVAYVPGECRCEDCCRVIAPTIFMQVKQEDMHGSQCLPLCDDCEDKTPLDERREILATHAVLTHIMPDPNDARTRGGSRNPNLKYASGDIPRLPCVKCGVARRLPVFSFHRGRGRSLPSRCVACAENRMLCSHCGCDVQLQITSDQAIDREAHQRTLLVQKGDIQGFFYPKKTVTDKCNEYWKDLEGLPPDPDLDSFSIRQIALAKLMEERHRVPLQGLQKAAGDPVELDLQYRALQIRHRRASRQLQQNFLQLQQQQQPNFHSTYHHNATVAPSLNGSFPFPPPHLQSAPQGLQQVSPASPQPPVQAVSPFLHPASPFLSVPASVPVQTPLAVSPSIPPGMLSHQGGVTTSPPLAQTPTVMQLAAPLQVHPASGASAYAPPAPQPQIQEASRRGRTRWQLSE
uniref:Uncharacterized protein n=1 Tax=Chromera velia CCMP2878 TaxID=1169474 RepID=A0A0G4HQS1_9ALVE|eukprot:Cvel_30443.t1-p1 / transcript=Cvel_30443.t1 / gene=Cvel_30443 / organism=Chromera_velia_CCMP2878 / gene_product=hypothetical protein / transcript_product=hypothetical protein / location=Cvel_scaffold4342:4607-6115(-) / protein_length=503 / sequence_SO=supercontig / SO=protein_coding / is_pseudo=false